MTEQEVKKFEEDVMLDQPLTFTLKGWVRSIWWQFWKKKKFIVRNFEVRRLRTWQHMKVQTIIAKIQVNAEDFKNVSVAKIFTKLSTSYHKDVVLITAICLSEIPCDKPDRELIKLIENVTTNEDLENIWNVMVTNKDAMDFINGIISLKGIRLTETNPIQ